MIATDLIELRRTLHRHPEPAWREFYTTARIVEELEQRDLDAIHVGSELFDESRAGVPADDELETWVTRARAAGAREDLLEQMAGGVTGAIAVAKCGDGPTVGLRVDIDALPIEESTEPSHHPAEAGFRSENEGYMHACGHDAHATIGIGVLDAILDSDFSGTLKVFFQPGEEQIVGGKPMANSGHLDDVDALFAVHVGLNHPTGEIVAGVDGFLAVSHFEATFHGSSAHAGNSPEAGDNAIQAAATAISNLYGIPRHADGSTRVNVGVVEGGTATNIVAERATIKGEVRGETTALMEYMDDRATRIIDAAAEMHGCEVELSPAGTAPSSRSSDDLRAIVAAVAHDTPGITTVLDSDSLGGSEDATYLMERVQAHGGSAAYVCVGTDHPGGHHTDTFDVDEETIGIAVDVLSKSILEWSRS